MQEKVPPVVNVLDCNDVVVVIVPPEHEIKPPICKSGPVPGKGPICDRAIGAAIKIAMATEIK